MLKSYVSIDIETTGLDSETCQVIQVGAVIDNWISPLGDLPRIEFVVMHKLLQGEAFALQMNQGILQQMAGITKAPFAACYPAEVGKRLHEFFVLNGLVQSTTDSVVAAGKNFASFDRKFLQKLPDFDAYVKFHHRCYDPGMLFMDFEIDELPPDSKKCMERAGLSGEVAHTALADAMSVVQQIRYARQRQQPAGVHPRSPLGNFLAATQDADGPEPRNGR